MKPIFRTFFSILELKILLKVRNDNETDKTSKSKYIVNYENKYRHSFDLFILVVSNAQQYLFSTHNLQLYVSTFLTSIKAKKVLKKNLGS